MSIYFYAGDKKEIKALCGVKMLIIPHEIAEKIKNEMDNIAQEKLSTEVLEEKFKQSLEAELQSKELEEEYNHFKCLIHSKTANFFHMRNIMLRYCYSSFTRNRITDPAILPHSIFREVLRYFIDYVYFHYAAFPFIEGHHLLLSEEEEKKTTEAILYPDRIRKAMEFLAKIGGGFNDKEFSYRRIGAIVDRNFCLLMSQGRKAFEGLEYFSLDEECLKTCSLFFWLRLMSGRLIRRPALWGYLWNVVISRIKIVYPYILGRLFPRRRVGQNIGILPAILCKEINIDPVAFAYEKQSMKSPEKPFPSKLHGGLGNLLWHILSRCAVIAGFIDLDVPEGDIYLYFKKLRKFNEKWKANAGNAQFELAHLDTEIIHRVTEHCDKVPGLSARERIRCLETLGMDIFKKYRDEEFFDFKGDFSSHNAAVNCSYMHI
jgi:hypothetical protein